MMLDKAQARRQRAPRKPRPQQKESLERMLQRTLLWLGVLTVLAGSAAQAQSPPSLPAEPGYPLAAAFDFDSDAQGRAVWDPMHETKRVSVVQAGPRKALRLPCNLAGTDMPRASWDWSVKLDLAHSRGVQFRFFCADPSPVSYFSIYFHSGGGWYSATFWPNARDAWNNIRIGKASTRMEDKPAGWGAVDTVRVSAWRGGEADTECHLADFGVWEGEAPVAILRQESAILGKHGELAAINKYAEFTAGLLGELGLPFTLLSDLDLAPRHLKDIKVLVLPYCPGMSDSAAAALCDYLEGGGKLVSFYSIPAKLFPAMGLKPGNHISQEREGHFASIRAHDRALTGLPPVVQQISWNIGEVNPIEGRSRVAAYWYNDAGETTGHAAVLVSDNTAHMTHVLLGDDRTSKGRLLLAMIGHFLPEHWEMAAERSLERAGAVGPYANFAEAQAGIRSAARAGAEPALRELEKAQAFANKATELAKAGKYPEAIAASGEARKEILNAYCSVQQPQPGEHRAFWCHSAFGVSDMEWDEAIKILADNGFTAILPNMLWGGAAYYASDVLPVSPEVKEKGDQIEQCLAACRKYGVECHVWKVNWNMGGHAPKEFVDRMNTEGRTQVMFDATAEGRWLCPSHPANQELEIDSMVEIAKKYDVHGVHFDYIRYPHANACFCDGCRKRFEASVGKKVKDWPADLRSDPTLEQQWLGFRRDQITKVVAAVSEQARKVRPGIKISAAVFRDWPRDRDTIGQDWKVWCDKDYLDFVCPMDYTPHNVQFENMARRQLEWAGDVPCYPGIGLSCWPDPTDIVKLIEQIKITRRLGTGGFTIFNYSVSPAAETVPLCGKGITRK